MIMKRVFSKDVVKKDFEPKNCYVCLKLIKTEKIYVGKGTYRHGNCVPGKSKWFKSPISKTTEKFYLRIKKETE